MRFLDNLDGRLVKIKREIQTLPGELDSIVAQLDRSKLQSIRSRLEQEFDQFIDEQIVAQNPGETILPIIVELPSVRTRRVNDQDLSRRREAYKSKVRVAIGEGMVKLMPVSEIAEKMGITISQITPVAQRKGYTVLSWDQHQRLLDEIDKLVN
jgi:hypothetical protein